MTPEMKNKLKKHYDATGRFGFGYMDEDSDSTAPYVKDHIKIIDPVKKLAKENKKAAAIEIDSPKDLSRKKKYEGKFAKGGKVMKEGKMMKKEGRGMAKVEMQKTAAKAVKGHETRMHGAKKMMGGGMTYKKGGPVDGCATKGKTKGKMVKMAGGGKTC